MNTLFRAMHEVSNYTRTENGALTYKSTLNGLMDLFAMGGAYRSRSDDDCIFLFKKAFDEDPVYAMKCLFYLRDVRGGQGQRRFFRVCYKWLAWEHTEAARRNLQYISEYGRYDDLFALVDTPLEQDMWDLLYHQLALDVDCKTPSLLAKWLPSENASSQRTRTLGREARAAFHMTAKEYRKTLSVLRERIRVVERLMSAGRWDEIEFDKLPSRAGLIYRNAFARRDILKEKYEKFAKDKATTVNADTLYPCDVVRQVTSKLSYKGQVEMDETERAMVNKYWDNLHDVFENAVFDGVAVVDTSASMRGGGRTVAPIDVAVALGMYCAEKCGPLSPWHGHYITFSHDARLVPVEGIDFADKVSRIYRANLCENTNIESVFNLILGLALSKNIPQEEMPKNIVIISDLEFDVARTNHCPFETVMEGIVRKYKAAGYKAPHLVFWCVQSRHDNIPMRDNGSVTFVSGYSPILFQQILSGKSGMDFVMDKLNSSRYEPIK